MTQYSKSEIDDALANYKALAKESHETGDWTRLEYGGNGLWRYEEDIYNSLLMREVFDEWVAAGGKPRAPLMDMQHGAQ